MKRKSAVANKKVRKQQVKEDKSEKIAEVIDIVTSSFEKSDKKLEEIANYCMDGSCREQQKA